ncbi:MAG: hypothetical protein LBM18_00415 [Oscillospiraceae bacterium]|jgi:hypothetical protein|nr:hypothetical protein [Oscillospiraceae bacterium]
MKNTRRTVCIALILVFALGMGTTASAALTASQHLASYEAQVWGIGSGDICIWYDVVGTGTMDQIGATEIVLQQKVAGSTVWANVKTFDLVSYPNMLGTNRMAYTHTEYYYSGIAGYSYRAYVMIYAGKGGSGSYRQFTTNVAVAT